MASKTDPLVACVMLIADRQELGERAVRCFQRQSYKSSWLVILDTGREPFKLPPGYGDGIMSTWLPQWRGQTIGMLRNEANALAPKACMIAHWDSDDISLPNRLEEQVKFLLETEAWDKLQGPGGELHFHGVAYRKLPFWNRHKTAVRFNGGESEAIAEPGAWIFDSAFPFPGATFLYRRSLWERFPFEDRNVGEDTWWPGRTFLRAVPGVAPMLCEIHGANTSSHVRPDVEAWKRHPELDATYRRILEEA